MKERHLRLLRLRRLLRTEDKLLSPFYPRDVPLY